MDGTTRLALHIAELLEKRDLKLLRRGADDFISGLVKAYGLVVDVDDPDAAMALALARAKSWHNAPFHRGDRIVIDTTSTDLPASSQMKLYHGKTGTITEARVLPSPQVVTLDDRTIPVLVNEAYLRPQR